MRRREAFRRRDLLAFGSGLGVLALAAPADAIDLGPQAVSGWAALDVASGRAWGDNADVRLPMCSSVKWLLAARLLAAIDAGREQLDRSIAFGSEDLVFNSPACAAAVEATGGGRARLTIEQLCAATVTLSDSAACNLLLAQTDGPAGLTAWLRAIGDHVTRLDRRELELNRVPAGDLRDTTSPAAMVADLRRLLYGPALKPASQARLLGWLLAARPGQDRLPAGAPRGWRVGHKTGTWRVGRQTPGGERNAAADVAVLLPPHGAPVLLTAYTAGSLRPQVEVDAWFAGIARRVTAEARRG